MKSKGMLIGAVAVIAILVIGAMILGGNKEKKNDKGQQGFQTNTVVEEYVDVKEDGTKVNTSTKLNQMKKLGSLEIGNIQLTSKNGVSVVLATVKNTGSTQTELTEVVLTLLDKSGNEIVAMGGLIKPLKAGESTELNIGATADFANSYDFKIEKK